MLEYITIHIIPFILGLITLITSIIVFIKKFVIVKNKKKITWATLKNHPIFSTFLEKQHRTIGELDISNKLKREMVQKSLYLRYKYWYNKCLELIDRKGFYNNEYIMKEARLCSSWFYSIIQEVKIEQLENFPHEYVERFSAEYITKIGQPTHKSIIEIYDNSKNIYDTDIEKLYAMFTVVEATIIYIDIVSIGTANSMNGELERLLEERENAKK